MYYGSNNQLILDMVILIGILSLILFIFNWIIRKLLNIKRPKSFFYHYVNDTHKKYDIGIRVISFIAYMIALFYYTSDSSQSSMETAWYLLIIGMFFTLLQELFRAYMEWKYLEGKNDYIFTLSQLLFIIALVIVVLRSEFFGIFKL